MQIVCRRRAGRRTDLQEVDELLAVVAVGKVEVDALVLRLDVDALLVRTVLQDELLQEHERPLVVDVLP